MSESQRNALNALLFQTGEQSTSFMMVLATNRPGDLDSAVTDRVDEAFSFPLPGLVERAAMLKLYFDTFITSTSRHPGGLWSHLCHSKLLFGPFARQHYGICAEPMTDEAFLKLARELDGFSGREIAKLMISVQGTAYGTSSGHLSHEMLRRVVKWKVDEHHAKHRMARGLGMQ